MNGRSKIRRERERILGVSRMSHRMVPPFVFLFGGQVTFRTSWRVSLDFVLFGVVCSVCVVYHEDKSLLHTIRDWDAASQALYGQGISPSISDSSRWPCHALLWLETEPRPIYRSLSLSLSPPSTGVYPLFAGLSLSIHATLPTHDR